MKKESLLLALLRGTGITVSLLVNLPLEQNIFLSILFAGFVPLFASTHKGNKGALNQFENLISGSFCNDCTNSGNNASFQVLDRHIKYCQVSREKTSEIIRTNREESKRFILEMKDSVYMITSINGSVQSINDRIEGLNQDFKVSTDAITTIAGTIKDFGFRIDDQSSAVIQISASVEQMDSSIKNLRNITMSKKASASKLLELTEDNLIKMREMNDIIEEINNNIGSVQNIISIINDIADMTTLLSINAAIEAAHAGMAGRGFAVVATEIRKLSDSTTKNAKLISETLTSMIDNINQVKGAGKKIFSSNNIIHKSTADLDNAFTEINNTTSELNIGSKEIVDATLSLKDITMSINEGAQEIGVSSERVKDSIISILNASEEGKVQSDKISLISQDINIMFMRITKSLIQYEEYLLQIQKFQSREFDKSNFGEIPKTKIILQHLLWMIKARAVIDGRLMITRDQFVDHHNCELGIWIDSSDSRDFKCTDKLDRLNTYHEKLHNDLNLLLEEMNELNTEDREKRYTDLLQISESIIADLLEI